MIFCHAYEKRGAIKSRRSSLRGWEGEVSSRITTYQAGETYCSSSKDSYYPRMIAPKDLRIGVFIPKGCQLLDMAGIDIFAMLSPSYLHACNLPAPLVSLGTPSTIRYISVPSTGTHVELTGSVHLKVTNTVHDKDVQPGMLDILFVPGPDPSLVFDEETLGFVRAHMQWQGEDGSREDVLSVCTGAFLLAQSGALKGKRASGPRALVPDLRRKFPGAEWVDDKRWVSDGNLWMSGGITNGLEMVAAYLREKLPGPATEAVIALSGVGEKGQDYPSGKTKENVWWLWQILKSVLLGIGKK